MQTLVGFHRWSEKLSSKKLSNALLESFSDHSKAFRTNEGIRLGFAQTEKEKDPQ